MKYFLPITLRSRIEFPFLLLTALYKTLKHIMLNCISSFQVRWCYVCSNAAYAFTHDMNTSAEIYVSRARPSCIVLPSQAFK